MTSARRNGTQEPRTTAAALTTQRTDPLLGPPPPPASSTEELSEFQSMPRTRTKRHTPPLRSPERAEKHERLGRGCPHSGRGGARRRILSRAQNANQSSRGFIVGSAVPKRGKDKGLPECTQRSRPVAPRDPRLGGEDAGSHRLENVYYSGARFTHNPMIAERMHRFRSRAAHQLVSPRRRVLQSTPTLYRRTRFPPLSFSPMGTL